MGDELTIGFTVTGLVGDAPVTLAGARPGERLILTKPLGTGTILAAEMQLAARAQTWRGPGRRWPKAPARRRRCWRPMPRR